MLSSIESEYLKFIVFSMRIFEDDEKWIWNIIFALFYAVVMMSKHSDLIRKKIVAWVNVLLQVYQDWTRLKLWSICSELLELFHMKLCNSNN